MYILNTFFTEAKVALQDAIKTTLETIADPEKVQGRLTKDDKVKFLIYCYQNDFVL